MTLYLIEAYTPTDALLAEIESRIRGATTDAAVRYLRTIYIPGDQTCLHLVEAPSLEHAQSVADLADLEPLRIVEALERGPAGAADLAERAKV